METLLIVFVIATIVAFLLIRLTAPIVHDRTQPPHADDDDTPPLGIPLAPSDETREKIAAYMEKYASNKREYPN